MAALQKPAELGESCDLWGSGTNREVIFILEQQEKVDILPSDLY